MRCAWTVGRATSTSSVYVIYMQCTYMKESLLGSLHSPGEPGQGFRAVGHQRLNNALSNIVLTLLYAGHLETARVEVWGAGEEGGEEGKGPKSRCAARGLWVGI